MLSPVPVVLTFLSLYLQHEYPGEGVGDGQLLDVGLDEILLGHGDHGAPDGVQVRVVQRVGQLLQVVDLYNL